MIWVGGRTTMNRKLTRSPRICFACTSLLCCLLLLFRNGTATPQPSTPKGALDAHDKSTVRLLVALAAILTSSAAPLSSRTAAALPTLNSLHTRTQTEKFVLKSIHDGREADVSEFRD